MRSPWRARLLTEDLRRAGRRMPPRARSSSAARTALMVGADAPWSCTGFSIWLVCPGGRFAGGM
eukprot:1760083-Alexandrium_andersonii.AAC.1